MQIPIILAAGGVSDITEAFGFNGWLLLSQCLSFSIVCIILYKFAYQRVLTVLEQRRRTIEQSLADAARMKTELAETEKRTAEIIKNANGEAQKLIEEARTAAKNFQEKQTQQAIAEAEQIVGKAREAAQIEHQRMLTELKREVARLVVDTTAKVTGKVLTSDDQRRLSEEASREIAA
jgi:F-type H+-transporting ATPase subunit b